MIYFQKIHTDKYNEEVDTDVTHTDKYIYIEEAHTDIAPFHYTMFHEAYTDITTFTEVI